MRIPRARLTTPLIAPLLAAAAVAVTIGAVSLAAVRTRPPGTPPGKPPALQLPDDSTAGTPGGPAEPTTATPAGAAGGGFRLVGPLPVDAVRTAAIYRLPAGAASQADVARLASALGLTGRPERASTSWRLRDGLRFLSVSDASGRPWQLVSGRNVCGTVAGAPSAGGSSLPTAELGDGGALSCIEIPPQPGPVASLIAPAPSPPTAKPVVPPAPPSKPVVPPVEDSSPLPSSPLGPPPGPPSPATEAAARALLDRLGVGGGAVRITGTGASAEAIADPPAQGQPTTGWSTVLRLRADGALDSAHGWLATPVAGPDYPVISATAAYDRLLRQPRRLGMPCRVEASSEGCGAVPDQEVTGARRGLTLSSSAASGADTRVLVPAWLFTVRGNSQPLPVVAVAAS